MLSHIATDLHESYVKEVFKPQLGKPGASEPERPTSSSDLDGDGKTDSFERKVRQFIYDVRHLMRKQNIPVERAFQMRSSKTNYGAEVIKTAKEKLGIKGGVTSPVSEEVGGENLYSIVINYKNGTTYRKRTSRSEISRLRSNPNVSSVEMTKYGVDGLAKKDYDGDGKIESGSKEHAGAVHNAIQRKRGGVPDGQDTRRKTSKNKLKSYGVSEDFSNWRQDLKETSGIEDEIASRNEKQIKEKRVNNYTGGKNSVVKINPEISEEVTILGGQIIESFELNETYLNEVVNISTEFFYNCGLNENGVDIVIEELGEDKFNEFIFDLAEEYFLSEERAARRAKPKKSVEQIKAEIDAREKAKAEKAETRKKIIASKAKEATEKAKETQAPSSEKSVEGKKKGIAGRVGAALGAVVKKGREDIKRVQDATQTARDVASRRGAEAAAVYSAARELGRKAEKSATATRARRKATVAAGRATQAAGRTAVKVAGAAGAASGEGVKAHRQGKTGAQVAGRVAGTFVRKMTKEELDLQEKSESEQQQKLFGLALSVKRGQTPRSEASPEVLKIVDSMSEKKIRDFAKTPHSEVPKKKVNEAIANPTPEKKSPLTTRKQKETARVRVLQRLLDLSRRNELGEEMEAETPKQISARNLELRAEKMRIAADQQALQQKKKKQIEKDTQV